MTDNERKEAKEHILRQVIENLGEFKTMKLKAAYNAELIEIVLNFHLYEDMYDDAMLREVMNNDIS
ncbi:hypothetical protein AB6C88_19935 [Vibrio splendidus]